MNYDLLELIYLAYYEVRKGKRTSANQLRFELDLESNLTSLCSAIEDRTYEPGRSVCFMLNELEIRREIFAADFRDRVVHRLLFDQINPVFEPRFIEDSYSCRVGKGTHYGVRRLDHHIRSCSRNFTRPCYILKMDIQGYFFAIDQKLLYDHISRILRKEWHRQFSLSAPESTTSAQKAPVSTPEFPTSAQKAPVSTPEFPTSALKAPVSAPEFPTSALNASVSTPEFPAPASASTSERHESITSSESSEGRSPHSSLEISECRSPLTHLASEGRGTLTSPVASEGRGSLFASSLACRRLDLDTVLFLLEKIIFHDPTKNCVIRGSAADWDGFPSSKSLFHAPAGHGLPIGNLTSQLFSNIYMDIFDQWVKRELHIRHYGRYVDDFYIVHEDRDYLKSLIPVLRDFLRERLHLTLHPRKIVLQSADRGVLFTGGYVKPYRIYPGKRLVRRLRCLLDQNRSIPQSARNDFPYEQNGHDLSSAMNRFQHEQNRHIPQSARNRFPHDQNRHIPQSARNRFPHDQNRHIHPSDRNRFPHDQNRHIHPSDRNRFPHERPLLAASLNSYLGSMKQYRSYNLRRAIICRNLWLFRSGSMRSDYARFLPDCGTV